MNHSYHSYQSEVILSDELKRKFFEQTGILRHLKNLYIELNQLNHQYHGGFITAFEFDKWVNHVYGKHPDFAWVKKASSKARNYAIQHTEQGFKRFFKKLGKCPKKHLKHKQDVAIHFVRVSKKQIIQIQRHKITIPAFGDVLLKRKNYLPKHIENKCHIKRGTLSYKNGRFYVSVLVEYFDGFCHYQNNKQRLKAQNKAGQLSQLSKDIPPLGIDLGILKSATCSNGDELSNVEKTLKMRKLEKQLKRAKRQLARQFLIRRKEAGLSKNAKLPKTLISNKMKLNRQKQQRLYQRKTNIRHQHQDKFIARLLSKARCFVLENLNIQGMIKNKHLACAISAQNFYRFRQKLTQRALKLGGEVRIVDRWFASSKLCSRCGTYHAHLTLKDRLFVCDCGLVIDRDLNASKNLAKATNFMLAKV